MKLTPRERFLAKVCPEPNGGCWLWRGMVVGSGYGMARFEPKMYPAHRLAWKLFRGEIAPGLVVCHKCDVRNCVNPEHLFLGTHAENMKDMKQKGRSPHGDEHSRSKLTAKNVSRIKAMLTQRHMRVSEIERAFGVTHATIGCIARGTSWRHVKLATAAIESDAVDQPKQDSISSITVPEDEF